MPVAKSYAEWERISEVYTVSGREYVKVRSPKGVEKQVRHYSQNEYNKMYGIAAAAQPTGSAGTAGPNHRKVLGFEDTGYITIFKNYTDEHEIFFNKSIARYCRWWGWYVVGADEVPNPLPTGIEPVRLPWELVGAPSGTLFPENVITPAIDNLLYADTESEYQGAPGDTIQVTITVTQNIPLENQFGHSILHTMEDENKNVYVWITAAKNWPIGSQKTIRAKIKEHKKYRGVCQTLINYCKEI